MGDLGRRMQEAVGWKSRIANQSVSLAGSRVRVAVSGVVGMRPFVSLILAALTAAGPWLCCCQVASLSRLTGQFADLAGLGTGRGFSHTCCSTHHRKPAPASESSQRVQSFRTGASQNSEPGHCTCLGDRDAAPSVDRTPGTGGFSPGGPDEGPLGYHVLPSHSAVCNSRGVSPGGAELPFLTTSQRLYAHHVLRC